MKERSAKVQSLLRPSTTPGTALLSIPHHSVFCTLKIQKSNTHKRLGRKFIPSDNPVVLVSQLLRKQTQDGVCRLKPMALDRTNPGTFLQSGHYLHMSRGTQEALERGSKVDTFPWEGTPKQGVGTLRMLWWRTQSWHSIPQSHWADRDGSTAQNLRVIILYIKKTILS